MGWGLFHNSDLIDEDDDVDVQSKNTNWKLVPEISVKEDCYLGDIEGTVRCTFINVHWIRNFETLQSTQDIQLDEYPADQAYTVYGWIANYPNGFTDYSEDNLVAFTEMGNQATIYPNAAK